MGTLHNDNSLNQKAAMKASRKDGLWGGANALFSSTQQRLLTLLFGQPERSFYARELIVLTGSGSGAIQRELARLVQSGLLTITSIGNQKHYQANPKAPVFAELHSLVIKSFGIADALRHALLLLKVPIVCAFIYGSVAKGKMNSRSDIDVMIVADSLTLEEIFEVFMLLEVQLGRQIMPTLYTPDEFSKRRKSRNPFLAKVLAGTIIPLIGDIDAAT